MEYAVNGNQKSGLFQTFNFMILSKFPVRQFNTFEVGTWLGGSPI